MWVYPQNPYFGTSPQSSWWWQLRWMKCLHCHPNSSKAWYRVHTTFDDPTNIYRHRFDITLQQHSCEYTPRSVFWHFSSKCNDGGSWGGWNVSTVIPTLQRLAIGSIQHLMTLRIYTDTVLTSHYSNIHVSIPLDPDFGTFLPKVLWWWQLRWMKCLHCHPNSSKTWYRVHTTFDDPTKIYRHRYDITLQWHSCEYTPRSPYFGTFTPKCNDGGSWGGWNVFIVIPTLQRLDIGSIQHLMTLQRYTDTVMPSHYSNIHVSIPPDPDFGTLTAKCNDGGSWGGWNVSTVIPTLQRLDIGSIQHLMTLQRYTDTVVASHYSNIHVSIPPNQDFGTLTKCNDGGSWGGWHVSTVIPTLQRLDIG